MMCHPTQDRPLSIKEYARIQQFPDDWIFTGTTAAKYRQIGNAVPVGLAEAIGKAVCAVADGNAVVETKRFRGTNVHNKIREVIKAIATALETFYANLIEKIDGLNIKK